ncbi:MAG: 4Fe-4S binding protein [Deltaproteobacteria bacterium]|nr:4Fe-4S binding protein [Deltaproteobacteria bacterium]
MRFQRLIQTVTFSLFIILLWSATLPLAGWVPVNLFLKLDPLAAVGTFVAAREWAAWMGWGVLILALTLILGRLFCGYVCPMGVTVDLADRLIKGRGRKKAKNSGTSRNFDDWRRLKYMILIGLLTAGLAGVSWVSWFSPLSLITRFYGLIIHPLILTLERLGLAVLRPVFPVLGLDNWVYIEIKSRVFSANIFIATLVLGILWLGIFRPRFWCRYLCPAGALMALGSRKPWIRRRVSSDCTDCGMCRRSCPMGAISEDNKSAAHTECLACRRCAEVCPVKAVSFGPAATVSPVTNPALDLTRRRWLGSCAVGATSAFLVMTNTHHPQAAGMQHGFRDTNLVRPPGAVPEPDFLAKCIRCGECMKACPTNTLQPVWWEAGIYGMFSPRTLARWDGCEQNCNLCGQVCPTAAIRSLPVEEKKYAKIGTAQINRAKCVAWEQDRKCLICDEICPYNAIVFQPHPGQRIPVPFVEEQKCNGCGFCESRCPVEGKAAIFVEFFGEVRLSTGSYLAVAKELGLIFQAKEGAKHDEWVDETDQSKTLSPGKNAPSLPSTPESSSDPYLDSSPQPGKLPPGIITR